MNNKYLFPFFSAKLSLNNGNKRNYEFEIIQCPQKFLIYSTPILLNYNLFHFSMWRLANTVELLTGGNVQMHDKLARSHRSSLDLIRSASTVLTQPHNYRPHAQRASTWCCGSFVIRQLHNT